MGCGPSTQQHIKELSSKSSNSSSTVEKAIKNKIKANTKNDDHQIKLEVVPIDQSLVSTTEKVEITRELLDEYLLLEKLIRQLERKSVLAQYTTAKTELDATCKQIDQTHASLPQQGEDYDTALENHTQLLTSLQAQKNHLERQIADLAPSVEKLKTNYIKRDKILENIFGGLYGSTLEDQLEAELINTNKRVDHIRTFSTHWQSATTYTEKAFEQMNSGYNFWQRASPKNFNQAAQVAGAVIPEQLQIVADTRSWLLAANANLSSAVRILIDTLQIKIPYCQPNELDTLNKAIHHIFIDCKSETRHEHAGKVYYSMGSRSGGLLKWLKAVWSMSISEDLKQTVLQSEALDHKLREERIRLLKQEAAEQLGEQAIQEIEDAQAHAKQNDDENIYPSLEAESKLVALNDPSMSLESAATALAAMGVLTNNIKAAEAENLNTSVHQSDVNQIEAMSLADIAPQPTRAQLYGHMFALMEESNEAETRLKEIDDSTKQKQNAALKAKLSQRRRRRNSGNE